MKFIQGIDYGPRKGSLGFAVHMTEGNGGIGDALYLAQRSGETTAQWKTRVRGVSANFVIIDTGEVIQMVKWGNASGSMNPANRAGTTGFYNTGVIRTVLGTHFTDPNAYSIAVEVAGKRADGPTPAQVKALVALVDEARGRFPTLRGAYGHADQTSTKGCPGLAAGMRTFWDSVGHGLFLPDTATGGDVERNFYLDPEPLVSGTFTVKTDAKHSYLRLKDGDLRDASDLGVRHGVYGVLTEPITSGEYPGADRTSVVIFGGVNACAILRSDVTFTPYQQAVAAYTVTVGGKTVGKVTLP
jgi:hypothetical protein